MTTEQRLEKLERDLATAKRRNLLTLTAAALVLVAVVTAGNIRPPADEVRAKRFLVVDDQGKERVVMDMVDVGPRFLMKDENGKTRLTLLVAGQMSAIRFEQKDDRTSVYMGVAGGSPPFGGGVLRFMDSNGDLIRLVQ